MRRRKGASSNGAAWVTRSGILRLRCAPLRMLSLDGAWSFWWVTLDFFTLAHSCYNSGRLSNSPFAGESFSCRFAGKGA